MITFNIQARNGNYFRGHEPCNGHSGPWATEAEDALVLTIDQARAIVEVWPSYLNIVIAPKAEPISSEQFDRELFCASGGRWYTWPHREILGRRIKCSHNWVCIVEKPNFCLDCGAKRAEGGYWYCPTTGATLTGDLKV
jgi:hypothetical protein